MNNHDLHTMSLYYDDSATLESVNWQGAEKGAAGVRNVYSRYFASSPDLSYKITKIVIGKNAATVEYTATGTMLHVEKNVPAYYQDKKYTLKNCTRMELANGKIIHEYNYFDRVAFLQQMGFFDPH